MYEKTHKRGSLGNDVNTRKGCLVPGRDCFISLVMVNRKLDLSLVIFSKFNICIVWHRYPETNTQSMTSFNVSFLRSSKLGGLHSFKFDKTSVTFHVDT